jgi:Mrp family chromosome partitioning ATPase
MDAEADEIITADPGLVSMKASLNQRRALLISQMANLTPNHPQYKQNAEELAQINASLEKMMKELRAKAAVHIEQRLRNDLERTSAYEGRLNGQLAQMSGVASSVTPRLQRASDLAIDIERLQNRYTVVDEQYRNLSIENQAPGAVYVSSPALPPLHGSLMHLLRNIVIILLGALVIAVGAAVVAHNLDPRVYIATDVERVLGFSPMAQLPDFEQVSSLAGEEYMLRLAAAIEHAYQQNGLKSCIITGAAPGAGTSTVASRVTTMLEGMGRSTVLVDASGTPPPRDPEVGTEPDNKLVSTREDNSPSSLLQQMAEETDAETIVLTDTAPLLASGETEYLARFVDSAIVVIQSGLTTRAQLREVAQTLQRLEVAAVGFVLNRVSIQKANPSFRQSVRAVEQRLAIQNRLRARHSPRTRPSAQHQREAQEPSVVTEPDDAKQPDLTPSQEASPQPVTSPEPLAAAGSVHTVVTEAEPAHVPRGRGEPDAP